MDELLLQQYPYEEAIPQGPQKRISLDRALGYLTHADPHSEEFKAGLDTAVRKDPQRSLSVIEKRLAESRQRYPKHYAYEEYWLRYHNEETALSGAAQGWESADLETVLYDKLGPSPERPDLNEPLDSPVYHIHTLLRAREKCTIAAVQNRTRVHARKALE